MEALLDRARADLARGRSGEAMTRGPMISRFSFAIDVNEWGLRDLRTEAITATRLLPVIQEIGAADVWDSQENDAP